MKFRMDKTLRFWVDCSYEDKKTRKRQPHEGRADRRNPARLRAPGDAMRYLDRRGQIAWKASPSMLSRLADAEREVEDDMEDRPVRASATAADTSFPLGRLKKSAEDPIPYSKEALRQDLARVRNAWEECQASRDRNAIYRLPERRVRSGDVVEGRRSGGQ